MSPAPLPCGPTPDPARVDDVRHLPERVRREIANAHRGEVVEGSGVAIEPRELPAVGGGGSNVGEGEWGWQYGHVIAGEWRWEPRGERYASSRRPWWMGAPEPIAHAFGPTDAAHGDPARTALRPADAEAHSPEETDRGQ